ncbi:MAG: type IV secretory system conjugative DNA transfer family protein [Lachnospiraceae bacterium]|nr:type IV secretory system conjugative DNA transfer family protein [Lachnospiraceae bacterium]
MMNYDKVILGEDVVFSTDCKETQINNNVIVCGSSGCGKTMSLIEPKLLCTNNSSIVLTLSKRRLVNTYTKLFEQRKYQVWDLNFVSPEKSQMGYDPLLYVKSWTDVTYLAEAIVMADVRKKDSKADPYWDSTSIGLLSALISHVLMTKKDGSMADVIDLFRELKILKSSDLVETTLDANFEKIRSADPKHFAVACWDSFKQTPIKTAGCIYSSLGTMLDKIFTPQLCTMMREAEKIDFKKLSSEKTILFVSTSAVNPSLNTFVNIFYSQMFKELFEIGEENENTQLELPVQVVCDDFACGAKILNFAEYISIFREKGISVTMMLQSESQLKSIYGEEDAKTIINNSDTYVYMGGNDLDTAKSVSSRLDRPLEEILYMPIGQEFIFRRGQKPITAQRYNILEDEEYQKVMRALNEAKER